MTLTELAAEIGAEIVGDGGVVVHSANTLEEAAEGQISFLSNPKYSKQLDATGASAVICSPVVRTERAIPLLKTKDPYLAFTKAVVRLHGFRKHPFVGIHPAAHVDPTVSVGENTVIYPGVFVGPGARIGRDCVLYPNVVIYDGTIIGDRVTIHCNSSIGQDGYGYATSQGVHHKIPQVGIVVIEDDVEIGSNCAIDRATLGTTLVSVGSKLSNLVTIGHGTKIGPHALLVAQVGIAGSVKVGHHVTMAGQVGVAGHLKIGDNITLGAQSGVIGDLPDQGTYIGAPAMPAMQARKVYSVFTQLPDLLARLKQLEEKVEELSTSDRADDESQEA